ncbi:hypothetical protein KBB96_04710 [Luteolibacter ambystomatis]|uniref:DUF4352 domain-containing protein n=1 Tax=Luteolibacter ambystomatis TaxID=2824561 RepID=A0A975PFS3_9BACT|nr:hypothetical protein [Luteolibacter ambystomatis]QUE52194.1 hypothetical protein KBB96_04710 [Luteolibacter ambystomatis]
MIRGLLSAAVAGCCVCQSVLADLAPLPLKVEGRIVGTGLDTDGKKGKQVQEKKLRIELTSLSPKDPGPLQVTCIFYARDLKTDKMVVEKELNLATALSKGSVTLETPIEDFKSNQQHYEGGGTKPNGKPKKNVKKVEASGREYAGWGIRVYGPSHVLIGKAYSAAYLDPEESK